MENKKITVYVILLLFLIFGIIGIAVMARSVSGKRGKQEVQSKIDRQAEMMADRDLDIFWIGDMPISLAKLDVRRVSPKSLNGSNMPVAGGIFNKTYNMIVVYRAELSASDLDIIQDCTVRNRVPILIIGKKPIEGFREYMLKAPVSYDDGSSLSYNVTDGMSDDVLDRSAVSTGGNLEGDAIISYIVDYYGFTDSATETEITTENETEEVTYTTLPAIDEEDLKLKKRVVMYKEDTDNDSDASAEVSDN